MTVIPIRSTSRLLLRRWAAAPALAPLAALALAAPAGAAMSVTTDPAGDLRFVRQGHSGDITKVRVVHGPQALRTTVRHAPDSGITDIYLVWIDTDPRNPGPEYRAGAGAEIEQAGVTKVDGWGRSEGTSVRCAGASVDFDFEGAEPGAPVRMSFPRSCLGNPDRVRVCVATEPDFPFKRIDWAPGKRAFGPWVQAG